RRIARSDSRHRNSCGAPAPIHRRRARPPVGARSGTTGRRSQAPRNEPGGSHGIAGGALAPPGEAQMNSAIRTYDLTKVFRGTPALDRFSLDVPEGSIYGLVGPNGAEKTTTIKVLMKILAPTRGRSEVLATDSRLLGPRDFAQIGYVSENQELPEWMTV